MSQIFIYTKKVFVVYFKFILSIFYVLNLATLSVLFDGMCFCGNL